MFKTSTQRLMVSSPAFSAAENIPALYTCDGENFNPSLIVENIPPSTESLALIMEDPDAPKSTFDHWIAWNIPVGPIQVDSNTGISGVNGSGTTGYHGPCPPHGSHRYYFYVYALDVLLDLPSGSTKKELKSAMKKHILASGSLMGRYQKIKHPNKAATR